MRTTYLITAFMIVSMFSAVWFSWDGVRHAEANISTYRQQGDDSLPVVRE
jgi:hypothetical protein